jgi:hypothetical protein
MDNTYSICLNSINFDLYSTPCNHNFHINCFRRYLQYHNNCPMCITIIDGPIIFENSCAICNDTILNDLKIGQCGHNFHIGCHNRNLCYNTNIINSLKCKLCNPNSNQQTNDLFNFQIITRDC